MTTRTSSRTAHRGRMPGFLSVALSLLLSVQVVLSFMPQPANAAGGVQIVICGAGGLRTVAFNPATGEEIPQSGEASAKCPFCVLGIALPVDGFIPPHAHLLEASAHFPLPVPQGTDERHWDTSRIRGPPLTV